MNSSPFLNEIHSIPSLVAKTHCPFVEISSRLAEELVDHHIDRIVLTGCGDSYHAAVATRLAFQQLTGLPCYALTSMELARYQVAQFMGAALGKPLVIAISNSGQVSRTVEALSLATQYGAIGLAVTGNSQSELVSVADFIFSFEEQSSSPNVQGPIVPGTRSYYLSLSALYHLAALIGLTFKSRASMSLNELGQLIKSISWMERETITRLEPQIAQIVDMWQDARRFVFCGSGPNFGTAMFSAAKMIEAAGEPAMGQDLEEWAHLQYFEKRPDTPTIIVTNMDFDGDRALEIMAAAETIGRRVALVAPETKLVTDNCQSCKMLTLAGKVDECWSPLLTTLPGLLLAAYRSAQLAEPFFRDFGGGRSRSGGGGISRIRDSHRLDQ